MSQIAIVRKAFTPKALDTQKLGVLLAAAGVQKPAPAKRPQQDNKGHDLGRALVTRCAQLYGHIDEKTSEEKLGRYSCEDLRRDLTSRAQGFVNQIAPKEDVPFGAVCDVTGHKAGHLLSHEFKGKTYIILGEADMAKCQEVLRDVFPTTWRKTFGEATEAAAEAASGEVIG